MLDERHSGRASRDFENLVQAFVETPAPSPEHLRESLIALGADPEECVARVRALMAAAERDVQTSRSARGIRIGRFWVDHRLVKLGTGAGVLGGICCLGKAVTVSAGLAVSSFFSFMVDQYQAYFVAGSLLLLFLLVSVWFVRSIRSSAASIVGLRTLIRNSALQAAMSFGTYFLTLGFSVAAMVFADWLWPRP